MTSQYNNIGPDISRDLKAGLDEQVSQKPGSVFELDLVAVYGNDEELRQKLFKYCHRSADHINLLENQQRRKYEIQAKLNDVVRDLQLRNNMLVREHALEQAVGLMHAENQELLSLNSAIPQGIQRMRDFKGEAKELLDAFSKGNDV